MESKGKISFGFKKAVPGLGGGRADPLASSSTKAPPRSSLFGEDDDEEQEWDDPKANNEKQKKKKKPGVIGGNHTSKLVGVAGAAPLSRSDKQRTEEALNVDASVFDYDGVYDSMKGGEREMIAEREAEKKKRDPKYISAFLASSEQRKIDRTRAEAKMIQRERDLEGEEFKDTESFVTDAYKKQMEEIQEAEVKEKEREEKDRVKSKGVAGFYKNYMEESDRVHQAAVTASLKAKSNSKDIHSSTLTEQEEENKMESQRKEGAVEEARKKGLEVRLNDDNEVVDERSLLSAGLNTFGKKKKSEDGRERDNRERGYYNEVGSSSKRDGAREAREAREAQRQRQSRMIEEQMLELEKKREEEARQEEEERKRTLVKERRNDQSSVASARERALERKRKREEEQTEKEKGSQPTTQ